MMGVMDMDGMMEMMGMIGVMGTMGTMGTMDMMGMTRMMGYDGCDETDRSDENGGNDGYDGYDGNDREFGAITIRLLRQPQANNFFKKYWKKVEFIIRLLWQLQANNFFEKYPKKVEKYPKKVLDCNFFEYLRNFFQKYSKKVTKSKVLEKSYESTRKKLVPRHPPVTRYQRPAEGSVSADGGSNISLNQDTNHYYYMKK